jgi:hypothetical protein
LTLLRARGRQTYVDRLAECGPRGLGSAGIGHGAPIPAALAGKGALLFFVGG